jgi:glycosyltransferase involved in cell wall biosynthesis
LSRRVYLRKKKAFSAIDPLHIIGLSRWLHDTAQKSPLLARTDHVCLPNPIDTTIFKPLNQAECRRVWNLPENKKLILFGAMGALSDPRKGFRQLTKALETFRDRADIELAVFGAGKPARPHKFGFKTHYSGVLYDDVSLVTLYNAVDVMVVPSLQENLSNTIMESLACGTPVVAFDIGGNPSLVDHKKNGYLAKPYDSTDLGKGISWLRDAEQYSKLSQDAMQKVKREFDSPMVAKRYIDFYKNVMSQ